MANDILDPAALISLLPTLLPNKALSSSEAALAALLHTVLSAVAFRLVGVDDTKTTDSYPNNVLPENWNQYGPGNFTFRYKHDQSSLEFIVKVSKLGDRTVFNAIAVENNKAVSLDVTTNDFVSPSFFPHDLGAADAQPLVHGYISSTRITDLVSLFKLKIVQPLIPGLRKEGYTETSIPVTSSSQAPAPNPATQPAPAQPRIPRFNPDEDEFPLRAPSHPPHAILLRLDAETWIPFLGIHSIRHPCSLVGTMMACLLDPIILFSV
ncbi:hypothetical protein BDZ89DRAFT_1097827 [Hymenopellis radicata]|nr:hypothetical protein BDZ89DRAFT_1097827 [Hymenopellis radicata]